MEDPAAVQVRRWQYFAPEVLFCQAEESADGRAPPCPTEREDHERAWDRHRLPKPRVNAMMSRAQGESTMQNQPNSRMCFVCGIDNPIGLHLSFYTDDEGRCVARFRPKPEHQGYPGHLHGGIISTLLDEPTQIPLHFIALLV
jgi:hypothetical protein